MRFHTTDASLPSLDPRMPYRGKMLITKLKMAAYPQTSQMEEEWAINSSLPGDAQIPRTNTGLAVHPPRSKCALVTFVPNLPLCAHAQRSSAIESLLMPHKTSHLDSRLL